MLLIMRLILLFSFLVSSLLDLHSQTMDSLFVQVPEAELPLLERNSRLDMLDLYNYKMAAKGENIFGGVSVMQVKDEDFVQVRLTDVSRWEMMRLKSDSLVLYACVHTLMSPAAESRVRFYHSDWTVDTVLSSFPLDLDDFFVLSDSISSDRREEVRQQLASPCVEASWERSAGARPILVFTVSVAHLSEDYRQDAKKCLRPVSFMWKDGRLERLAI